MLKRSLELKSCLMFIWPLSSMANKANEANWSLQLDKSVVSSGYSYTYAVGATFVFWPYFTNNSFNLRLAFLISDCAFV